MLNYQIYAGTSGPYNFNGLVRHYYMRRQPNQADIQVNLLPAKPAQRAEPRHRQAAAARCSTRSATHTARASRSLKFRPARRCCKRWWPKSTARVSTGRSRVAGQVKQIFQQHAGRRGYRLVHGRPAAAAH